MRSPRQLSNSPKEWGKGTRMCVRILWAEHSTQISALSKLYHVPKCYEM